ncbi:MAG: HU family DNA-binding protein [Phycisphaerales bacterium]|nr:MAG: HU family DNA-binding protein [Phycisphaerales bacterium]
MSTITKKELIESVAESTSCKRVEVKMVVQAFLDQIIEELSRGNRIELRDFGVLEPKERAPRTAQNPKTLERVQVPARRTVKFKVGRLMQRSVETPNGAVHLNGHLHHDDED